MPTVKIYTDGSARNPGPGGWGCVLLTRVNGQDVKEVIRGHEVAATTSQRMELMAAIKGLEHLKRPCEVALHTDSQYVITTASSKRLRKNLDLVKRLRDAMGDHRVTFYKVKAHAGDHYNELVHTVAKEEYEKASTQAQDLESGGVLPEFSAWYAEYFPRWVAEALQSPHKVDRLYPFCVRDVNPEPYPVTTPDGPGRLHTVRSDYCMVQLLNETTTNDYNGAHRYVPMREYSTDKVHPPTLEELTRA